MDGGWIMEIIIEQDLVWLLNELPMENIEMGLCLEFG